MKVLAFFALAIAFSGCNLYQKSLCENREKLNLDAFIGEFRFEIFFDGSVKNEIGAELTAAKAEKTYTLKVDGEDGKETLLPNAVACKVGSHTIMEQDMQDGTYMLYGLDEKLFNLKGLVFMKEALDADKVSYEDMGEQEWGGILLKVDNEKMDDEKLIQYLAPVFEFRRK